VDWEARSLSCADQNGRVAFHGNGFEQRRLADVRSHRKNRTLSIKTWKSTGSRIWATSLRWKTHNLKVVGSNPTPATNKKPPGQRLGGFFVSARCELLRSLEALWKQAGG
jgi:hypothetical protein